jgi:dihydrofolate synthase/folylpolyglutamate synthase
MLDSVCRAAGIKSGLYTSPHLVSITERIKISGIEITREDFAACATVVRERSEQLEA